MAEAEDLFPQGWLDRLLDEVKADLQARPPHERPALIGPRSETMRVFYRSLDDFALPPAGSHEFCEDVADASMCAGGIPALTHDRAHRPRLGAGQ